MFNKRGMSPIVATVLLIAFAVALGAMVMKLGQNLPGGEESCEDVEITTGNLCNKGGVLYPYIEEGKDKKRETCWEVKLDPDKITTPCP